MKLTIAMIAVFSRAKPAEPAPFKLFLGANGPTIFLIGSTFSFLPNSSPFFMAGSPSILHAFLYAQYLTRRVSPSSRFLLGQSEYAGTYLVMPSFSLPALNFSSFFRKWSFRMERWPLKS